MNKIKLRWEKFRNVLEIIKLFAHLSLKYDKWYFLFYFPLMAVNTILPFVGILFPKYIIDAIQNGRSIDFVILLVMLMFMLRLFLTLILQVLTSICERRIIDIRNGMRIFLNEKSLSAEYEKLETPAYLDMKANAITCIDNYDIGLVAKNIADFCSSTLTLLGLTAVISTLNVGTIFLIIFITCINGLAKSKQAGKTHFFRKSFSKLSRKLFYIIGVTWDYQYAKDIRAFQIQEWLNEKKQNLLKEFSGNSVKIFVLSTIITLLSTLTSSIQTLVVYLYLVVQVFKSRISIGDFSMYLSATSQLSAMLALTIDAYVSIAEAAQYFKDYVSFCGFESENKGRCKNDLLPEKYELEFQDVTFFYPGQKEAALKNVSLKIKQNEKLSIVGENGAGKSTFVKLLMRLYKPTSGKILLNGIDIQEIDPDCYMRMISVVFQDYKIFAFSLRENVCGYSKNEERLIEVIKNVGLEDKIATMKKNYDTNLSREFDDEGIELSGGEQQKVAIAQALYKNAPIIILDEPTSNMSPIAEYELYRHFNELVSMKTAIFISHRLSSCKFCDRIIVLEKGEMVECGSHDELMRMQGIYSTLFLTQAQFYDVL